MTSASAQIAAKARRLAPFLKSGVVTLQGPQGSGKSALVEELVRLKREEGVRCAAASLDGLLSVAAANPTNSLLHGRGLPGTHDLALLSRVLSSISSGQPTSLPSFDKSLYSGYGDRRSTSIPLEPVDLFILEGWCINTLPLPSALLAERHEEGRVASRHELSHLETINKGFEEMRRVLEQVGVETRVNLSVGDRGWVYAWRKEQEHKLKEERGEGMSDAEVEQFVDRYMPVYELFDSEADVEVKLDRERRIVDVTTRREAWSA